MRTSVFVMNCDVHDTPGRRLLASLAALAVLLTPVAAAAPARADGVEFRSGFGITVTGSQEVGPRTVVVDVGTPAVNPTSVNGAHQVRVLLPNGYRDNPGLRYPVLYLLHGGAGGSSRQWTAEGGAAEAITAGRPVITVMPDGGKVGWYTNWLNPANSGPQRWADFHLGQLIPWVDLNLRTIADKRGRAIAGLSMGGFGAINYAATRPDLFAHAAAFSGALDLDNAGIRAVVTEQAAQIAMPPDGPFGPPVWPLDGAWNASNPLRRAESLRGVSVSVYAGAGTSDLDVVERTVGASTDRMHHALDAAGIPHYYEMYGRPNRPMNGFYCDGGHDFGCWNYALSADLPRMLAVLSHP
jgi:S-formylglutathione hydrolase FrmB